MFLWRRRRHRLLAEGNELEYFVNSIRIAECFSVNNRRSYENMAHELIIMQRAEVESGLRVIVMMMRMLRCRATVSGGGGGEGG